MLHSEVGLLDLAVTIPRDLENACASATKMRPKLPNAQPKAAGGYQDAAKMLPKHYQNLSATRMVQKCYQNATDPSWAPQHRRRVPKCYQNATKTLPKFIGYQKATKMLQNATKMLPTHGWQLLNQGANIQDVFFLSGERVLEGNQCR